MLSSSNEQILRWFIDNDKVLFSDEAHPEWITEVRLDTLSKSGELECIRKSSPAVYRITPAGEDALHALYEERCKRAEEKIEKNNEKVTQEQHRKEAVTRSWVQFAITTILSVLAFFAGAITEVFTGFIERVWTLFQ